MPFRKAVVGVTALCLTSWSLVAGATPAPFGKGVPPGTALPLLSVDATPDGGNVNLGQTFSFTIVVDNVEGSAPADLPSLIVRTGRAATGTLDVTSVTTSQGQCTDSSGNGQIAVSCNIGDGQGQLQVDAAVTVRITAVATGEGNFDIAAQSATKSCSTCAGNDVANVVIVPGGPPDVDLALEKTVGRAGGRYRQNEQLRYTLRVTQLAGSTPSAGFIVTDTLPPEVSLDSVTPTANWDCTSVVTGPGGSLSCQYIATVSLAAASNPLIVNATAVTVGTNVVNRAELIPDAQAYTDINPQNDTASAAIEIAPGQVDVDLSIDKAVDVGTADVGAPLVYTLTITNNDTANVASGFVVTDPLPEELELVSVAAPGSDFDCSASTPGLGGTVACTASVDLDELTSTTLTVNAVAIAPGAAVTNTATVAAAAGSADPNLGNNQASATVTINGPSADLAVDVTATPTSLQVGETSVVRATATNLGPDATRQLQLAVSLPDEVAFQSLDVAGSTSVDCQHDGAAAGGAVICSQTQTPLLTGSKGATGAVVLDVTVTAREPSPSAVVTATVEDPAVADPVPSNNTATVALAISPVAGGSVDLSLVKESGGATRRTGVVITYAFEVRNRGTASASAVQVVDDLPNGVVFRSADNEDWTCAANGAQVICDYLPDTLEPGGVSVFTIEVDGPDRAGPIINRASVSSLEADVDPANNEADDELRIVAEEVVDLRLEAVGLPPRVAAGESFIYDLLVTNNGSSSATDVRLEGSFSGDQSFLSDESDGWTCTGDDDGVSCAFDQALAPGAATALVLAMEADGGTASVGLDASVSSAGVDAVPGDNEASAEVSVSGPVDEADLMLVKVADVASVFTGGQIVYTLTVSNAGPAATDAIVFDRVLNGLTLVSADGPGFVCDIEPVAATCETTMPLEAGASRDIILIADVTALDGVVVNQASVAGDVLDPDPGNNEASVQTPVTRRVGADVFVEIGESADPVPAASPVVYTLTVGNNGPDTAGDVSVGITLNDGLEVVASSNRFACAGGPPSLECELSGTLGTVETAAITLEVTAPVAGSISVSAVVTAAEDDPDPSNNSAAEQTEVTALTAADIEGLLDGATGDNLDPFLGPLSRTCARPDTVLAEQCRELIEEAQGGGTLDEEISGLLPEEVLTIGTALTEAQAAQFDNVGARLSQLRGGAGGVSFGGLGFRYGNESFSLALLQGENESGGGSDLVSPWGLFVNGSISAGDRDPTSRQSGFDFDTYGITAGVDYRLSETGVLGLALGWAQFDSDDPGGSTLETEGFTLTGYGSFFPKERWYLDGRISYGDLDLDQRRRVRFTLGAGVDEIAAGRTGADQLTVAVGTGYNFNNGRWNIVPNATLRYQRSDVDGFTESGGGPAAFAFSAQEIDSLILSGGVQVSRVFSLSNGVLTPGVDLNLHRELDDDAVIVDAELLDFGGGESFRFRGDDRDSNYGSIGVSLVFVSANGKQFYANVRNMLGLSDFSRWTLNLGARFEF